MTEQYRDGSDDGFFLFTSSQHTAMKIISFFIPLFPSLFFNTTAL